MTHDVVSRERWQVDENLSCISLLASRNQSTSIGERVRVELRRRVPASWMLCVHK
jgi:hypothetical protein